MRILSITAQKPHSTGSGVYLTELVKAFQEMGHEQAVIAGVYESDVVEFPEGVTFLPVYFRSPELPYDIVGMSDEMPYESTRYCDMTKQMWEMFERAFSKQVKMAVQRFQPDVILCHHLYQLTAWVKQWCPKVKVAAICHGSDLRQMKKNTWNSEGIREGIGKLDMIFALHKVQRREICSLFTVSEDKAKVIGTGYNHHIFREGCGENPPHQRDGILFVGKLSMKKGVGSLLKSVSQMQHRESITLTLVGGAGNQVEAAKLYQLAKECPAKVELTGRLHQEEVAQLMRQHEVFVLPSFYEGLPLVVIEALACGMKVVCTDLPGIKEWMDAQLEGHGVIFVKPPEMIREDEPLKEELPEFEHRLAGALETAVQSEVGETSGLKQLSWEGIGKRILVFFEKQ